MIYIDPHNEDSYKTRNRTREGVQELEWKPGLTLFKRSVLFCANSPRMITIWESLWISWWFNKDACIIWDLLLLSLMMWMSTHYVLIGDRRTRRGFSSRFKRANLTLTVEWILRGSARRRKLINPEVSPFDSRMQRIAGLYNFMHHSQSSRTVMRLETKLQSSIWYICLSALNFFLILFHRSSTRIRN